MNLYPMVSDRQPRLLGVFAHPDDEVFCAGGTLAQWAAAGAETMVISATRGEAGQIHDARAATRRTLGGVRERELRGACKRLGVQRVECLDYQDGALGEADLLTLTSEVAARIRAFRPDVIVTFGPDGGYGHPDHIAISAATTRACELLSRLEGYAPRLYYSVFPRQHRQLCYPLARWLIQYGTDFHGSDAFVRSLCLLAEEATLLRYVDESVDVRWFPAGVVIAERNEPGTSLYLIVSGHADVIQEDTYGTTQSRLRLGPGQFFGQEALIRSHPYTASVVATDTVTCLALSLHTPTPFDGRGVEARLGATTTTAHGDDAQDLCRFMAVDVSAWLDRKVAALSAHHTQFLMEPEMFPASFLKELLGREYFAYTALSTAASDTKEASAKDMHERTVRQEMPIPA